jgi:hypothetical protein
MITDALMPFRPLMLVLCLIPAAYAADLKPETVAAFDRYVRLSEQRMANEARLESFLWLDGQPSAKRMEIGAQLKSGKVITGRLETMDQGKAIPVPAGMIHHWIGTVFIPHVTLPELLKFLQDYDHQSESYAPDVERSKLLARDGEHFRVFLRLRKTKVVTVVMNTEYDVQYSQLDANRATSRSYSTRIAEVENAGKNDERENPVGHDTGFMWRLNSYWRFEEKDGGTYVQLEAISLTRDIPAGLGWLIGPFVTSIPQQSIVFTLSRTRDRLSAPR